ncbi:MAG: hypothetical protein P4L50_03315 [Anaerolineaceae bacterium]|nr:hypothetical protein [Anaerolineaceae bacterium]
MTLLTRATDCGLDSVSAMHTPNITGCYAGEDLDIAAPCYIKQADGLVYMSNATAANEAAGILGFTPRAVKQGQPVTLFGEGTRFSYASGMTPGQILYIGATKGRLDSAATVGDLVGVAQAVNATDVVVIRDSNTPLTALNLSTSVLKMFVSTVQTGTGASQNIAHGLGVVPLFVVVIPVDLSPATVGQFTVTEQAHDSTNVKVTVTTSKTFKVIAFA